MVNALNNHSHELQQATNMFVDLSDELYEGLELLDPALARCCHTLCLGKFDFLDYISHSVHWDRTSDKPRIVLKKPRGRMLTADTETMYQQSRKALAAGDKFFWPESALDDFTGEFDDISIGPEDDRVADDLHAMIVEQNSMLKAAKERLRTLIKESFSIEEVLFQSDSHPYR